MEADKKVNLLNTRELQENLSPAFECGLFSVDTDLSHKSQCMKLFMCHHVWTWMNIPINLLEICVSSTDPKADKSGTAAFQWRGGDAEVPAASKHRPFLRLLEVHHERAQVHHPGDGVNDVRDAKDVSSVGAKLLQKYLQMVWLLEVPVHKTGKHASRKCISAYLIHWSPTLFKKNSPQIINCKHFY